MKHLLLALAAIASALGTADARRVVHMPTLAELCPGNAEWSKVTACMKRNGAGFEVVRDDARVKLVHVTAQPRYAGFYLFTYGKTWQLRGQLATYVEHDLLRFERVTFGPHAGYRIDAGLAVSTALSLDGETNLPAKLRQQLTLVCFDDRAGCVQMFTACDLLVHGKAYAAFRGKLVYSDRQLKVVGDRRNTGAYCQQAELVVSD